MDTVPSKEPEQPDWRGIHFVAFGLVALSMWWAYKSSFVYLVDIWQGDPNYTYCFLVIPAALLILWLRKDSLDTSKVVPWRWGWALLALVFAVRAFLYERNEIWLEDATIPCAVGALALAFGGWQLFRWALPGIIFLGFMLPLPNRVNATLAYQLQTLATVGSCDLLQMLGLPAVAEGNVVNIGAHKLEVARACNGLSMLFSFITLITAAAILLVERPLLDRIILLVSAIPIALAVNILRITITGLCFNFFDTDELLIPMLGTRLPHDWAGYLMPAMGLCVVWLELKVLSWLTVVEEEPETLSAFSTPAPGYRPPTKAAAGGA